MIPGLHWDRNGPAEIGAVFGVRPKEAVTKSGRSASTRIGSGHRSKLDVD
jgi:hypothetical protein